MTVQTALTAIHDWYEGENYYICGITDDTGQSSKQEFEQSDTFLEVVGWQSGDESGLGPGHYGEVYFKIGHQQWVKTYF